MNAIREEHRLRVFQNRVLRTIFGPEEVQLAGNCKLRTFINFTQVIRMVTSRRIRLGERVGRMEGKISVCEVFLRKPEEKSPLGRPNYRWKV
jgi:hypothetical protein